MTKLTNFKRWIDESDYTVLLHRWRFNDSSDQIFQGKMGEYYSDVMSAKKAKLTPGEQVAASKRVGWDG